MRHLIPIALIFQWTLKCHSNAATLIDSLNDTLVDNDNKDFYKMLLLSLRQQQTYESILVMQTHNPTDRRIHAIYDMEVPKIIITPSGVFGYYHKFNCDILVILTMQRDEDIKLLKPLATTMNLMRQARILLIMLNINENAEELHVALLKHLRNLQMTNVIVHFSKVLNLEPANNWYYQLRPYPKYHWEKVFVNQKKNTTLFIQHWWNMQNMTVLTMPDQNVPNSVMYKDSQGRMKFNGNAARMVLLFGEKFNVSLQLAYPVNTGDILHVARFLNLTQHGIVDIPMSYYGMYELNITLRMTYPTQLAKIVLMVPCAKQLTVKEVYGLLLTGQFFVCLLIPIVAFTLMHSLIEYVAWGSLVSSHLLINDKVVLGVMGQPFVPMLCPLVALKVIYLLIFLFGLNLNTLFSANVQTLITSAPFHRETITLSDVLRYRVKVLVDEYEMTYIAGERMQPIKESLVPTANTTYLQHMRKTFNTTYAYYGSSELWKFFQKEQSYYAQKIFCSTPFLVLNDFVPYSFVLEENSPFKEPLNLLIHRVHEMDLATAWRSSAFLDMVDNKNITRNRIAAESGFHDLTTNDLEWTWIFLGIGLTLSITVLLLEIMVAQWMWRA